MRKARFLSLLIFVLPVLAVAMGALTYLASFSRIAMGRLPEVLSTAASEQINGKITIGGIRILPLRGVILSDVTVYNKEAGKQIARIPELRVFCNTMAILHGADPAANITQIDILRPDIMLERKSNGRWAILDLLKPSAHKKKTTFHPKIFVKSAHVILLDRHANPTHSVENRLANVNAAIHFAEQSVVKYSVWGLGKPGRLGRFALEGEYNRDARSHRVTADVFGADAKYWSTYPWHVGVKLTSGTADVKIELRKVSPASHLTYAVGVQVKKASVRIGGINGPFKDVSGDVQIQKDLVGLQMHGRLGASPMAIDGSVSDFSHPRLALNVTSNRANFREIAAITGYTKQFGGATLPVNGRANARISGRPAQLGVRFNIEAPSLSYRMFDCHSIRLAGGYSNHEISIDRATAKGYAGTIEMSGVIPTAKGSCAQIDGNVSGIHLDQLPALRKQHLSGSSDGTFQAICKTSGVSIRYIGDVDSARIDKLKLGNGKVDLTYDNGSFKLNEISAKAFGGLVAASGDVGADGKLRLHISGAEINLASASGMLGRKDISGSAQFSGDIGGTTASPVFDGSIEGYKLSVADKKIERISCDLLASRKLVYLHDLTVYDRLGKLVVSGRVNNPLAKVPALNLSVKADSLNIDRIARLFTKQKLTGGRLSGELRVSGTTVNPVGAGTLRVDGGAYRGLALDKLSAKVGYIGKSLRIEGLEARSGDTLLTMSGRIPQNGQIDGHFSASHIQLSKFSDLMQSYAMCSGDVDFSGDITGTMQKPHAELAVDCHDLAFNGQKFNSLIGKVSIGQTLVSVSGLNLSDAKSRYSIPSASYDLTSKNIAIDAQVRSGDLAKLFTLVDFSPKVQRVDSADSSIRRLFDRMAKPLKGSVDLDVSGTIKLLDTGISPNLYVKAAVDNFTCGATTVNSMSMEGCWKDGIIRLQNFQALDGDTNIAASGTVGPADVLDVKLDAHNLPMAALNQWFKFPDNFSGRVDVTLLASGNTAAPNTEIYAEAVDPTYGGLKLDRIRCRLSSDKTESASSAKSSGRLNIDDLMFVLGNHSFKATGYLPVDWKSFNIPGDGDVLLHSNLDSSSLTLISSLSDVSAETGPDGVFNGSIGLSGTINSPRLEGGLSWQDGRIRFPRVNSAFEKINAKILLDGNKLTIDKISGISSDGGSFGVSGDIAFAGMKPALNLSVVTDKLAISGRNISNTYGEDINARFTSDVKVSGDLRTPLIAGIVHIPDGLVALTGKAVQPSAPTRISVDPSFKLDVLMDKNVQFKSAQVKAPVFGNLSLVGSLSKPKVDGSVDISDGMIIFPMSQLKILPGSRMSLHFPSLQQSPVYVDMQAQGYITALSNLRQQKRYTIGMVAKGPLDNLDPSFSSSPAGMSESRIVALLTGQGQLEQILVPTGTQDFGTEIGGLFTAVVAPGVFNPIEKAVQDIFGIQEFGLAAMYNGPLQVTVGNKLWDGFYLSYSSFLGQRPDYIDSLYELKLSHRLSDSLDIGAILDDQHAIKVDLEGKLRF